MEKSLIDVVRMQKEYEALGEKLNKLSQSSPDIRKALQFREELRDLLAKHKFTEAELLELLKVEAPGPKRSKKRPMFRFTNPHTGEHVDTRGGNHTKLKEWREKYGADKVESWKKKIEN